MHCEYLYRSERLQKGVHTRRPLERRHCIEPIYGLVHTGPICPLPPAQGGPHWVRRRVRRSFSAVRGITPAVVNLLLYTFKASLCSMGASRKLASATAPLSSMLHGKDGSRGKETQVPLGRR